MEGPHYVPAAPPHRSLDAARVAGPTTYLEDLVACPGCPELAIRIRFAPVARPDPNPDISSGFPVSTPPESLPDLLRSLPRIRFPASAVAYVYRPSFALHKSLFKILFGNFLRPQSHPQNVFGCPKTRAVIH
jgi:hypothetical protein